MQAELEPVVGRRVVGCRDLHAARGAKVPDGEVVEGRRAQAAIEDLEPGGGQPVDEGVAEAGAVGAHVAPHDDGVRAFSGRVP